MLTTFLLLLERYRYFRAPKGLCSSSDGWCHHSDRAIKGLTHTKKIVDDILVIVSWIVCHSCARGSEQLQSDAGNSTLSSQERNFKLARKFYWRDCC